MRIKIHKQKEVVGGFPARSMDDHVAGIGDHGDNKSLPIDYSIEGELVDRIIIGKPVLVLRDMRNGVSASGIFQTSVVTKVTKKTFHTRNSVYDYELVKEV